MKKMPLFHLFFFFFLCFFTAIAVSQSPSRPPRVDFCGILTLPAGEPWPATHGAGIILSGSVTVLSANDSRTAVVSATLTRGHWFNIRALLAPSAGASRFRAGHGGAVVASCPFKVPDPRRVLAGLPRLSAHPLGRLWPREAGAHVCAGVARSVHPMRAASHSAAAFKTDTLAAQAAGNDQKDDDDGDDDDITKNGTAGVTSSASILGRAVASTLSGISGLLAGGSKRGGGSGGGSGGGEILCKAPLARVWKLAVGAALDVDDDDDDDVDGGDDDDIKKQSPVQIAPCRACRGSPLDCAFAGSGPLFASPVHAMARAGQRVAIARVLAAHGDRSVRRTRGKKKLRKKNTFKN
jgi:hypothetical protein